MVPGQYPVGLYADEPVNSLIESGKVDDENCFLLQTDGEMEPNSSHFTLNAQTAASALRTIAEKRDFLPINRRFVLFSFTRRAWIFSSVAQPLCIMHSAISIGKP